MATEQAFDLIARPDLIQPPYGFDAIFVFAGLVIAAVTWLSWRFTWRNRKFLAVFAPAWIGLVTFGMINDAIDVWHVRDKVEAHRFTTIAGCLTYFHPGEATPSQGSSGDERWSLAGHSFSYGSGNVRPGYHMVEPAGGIVHADSRLSVSYVTSDYYGRSEIVRIRAIPHACPEAPDQA
jgi:hypothetical protein